MDDKHIRLNAIAGLSAACDYLTLSLLAPELITDSARSLCFSCFDISYGILKEYEFSVSPLSKAMYFFAKALATEDPEQRKDYKDWALDQINQSPLIAPYDKPRNTDLRKAIREL